MPFFRTSTLSFWNPSWNTDKPQTQYEGLDIHYQHTKVHTFVHTCTSITSRSIGLAAILDYWWFPPGAPISSTNKTNLHNITEILMKMTLNTINHKCLKRYFNVLITISVNSQYFILFCFIICVVEYLSWTQ